jgi:hypothetical protein
MGEFLTECSNLENVMITMMMFCQDKKHFEEVHLALLNETFGTRLNEFKKAVAGYPFSTEHRVTIEAAVLALEGLLPRRNMIVHGVTMEVGFGSAEPKAYRIGVPKRDLNYLNKFLRHAANVEHSFSIAQVRQATADCKTLSGNLALLNTYLINLLVVASQP